MADNYDDYKDSSTYDEDDAYSGGEQLYYVNEELSKIDVGGDSEPLIPRQPTAPTDTTRLWIDTSSVPNIWKRHNGTQWIPATPTDMAELGGQIVSSQIGTGAVTTAKIAANAVTAAEIAANVINANHMNITSLSAISANLGTVTAGTLQGLTIVGGSFQGLSGDVLNIGSYSAKIDTSLAGSVQRLRLQVDSDTYLGIDEDNNFHFVMGGIFNTQISKNGTHPTLKLGTAIIKGLSTSDTIQVRTWDDSTYAAFYAGSATFSGSIAAQAGMTASSMIYANGGLTINANGGAALDLVGTDHVFMEWYPDGTGAGRKGWMGYSSSSDVHFTINNGSYGEVRLQTASCTLRVDEAAGGGVFIRNGGDTSYLPIAASAFNVNSRMGSKKNIAPFTMSAMGKTALEEIMSTQVSEYHLIEDSDMEPKRVGLVYEDAPFEVVDLRGNGIDLYPMVALSWKAIQELESRIRVLEGVA